MKCGKLTDKLRLHLYCKTLACVASVKKGGEVVC